MFWQSHAATSASVDQLLDKEDATLEQLLDEVDIIQECKAQNSKVVEFLTRAEVLSGLVELLVTEPAAGADLSLQYRQPSLACEVLQCAIPAVLDRLAAERGLLERLCAPLRQPAPLNPLLASFMARTISLLIGKRTEQTLEFVRAQDALVDQLLQHLGTSAVMDLLCHLVAGLEEPEPRQATSRWLSEWCLVPRLAQLVGDAEQPERQANAAIVLGAIIADTRQMLAADEVPNSPLMLEIESEEFVASLLDAVLSGGGGGRGSEAGLVSAVHVLVPLLDVARPGMPPPIAGLPGRAAALLARLPQLHEALVSPPARPDLVTSWGRLSPPLGATRLQVARLVAALLATGMPEVHARLAALGTVDVLLDLFFHYTLNNFLHSQVELCVSFILDYEPQETTGGGSGSQPLLEQLFTSSRLIQRILQGLEESSADQCGQNRCARSLRGYGGHLISIANKVVSASAPGTCSADGLRRLLDLLPEDVATAWRAFCDSQLRVINEMNKPLVIPDRSLDSSNDSDFRGVSESQQEVAAMMKVMRQRCEEGLDFGMSRGFDDGDFRHFREVIESVGEAGLGQLSAEAESRPGAAELFEQQCAERLGGFGGGGGGGGGGSAGDWPLHSAVGGTSSSDEDDDDDDDGEGRVRMEVDTSDPWSSVTPATSAMDTNVWQSAPAADLSAERHWADFDAFPVPAVRPPSPPPPPLPAPAAALGVSPDSQSSAGVPPPRPPGAASPHFPVDFDSSSAFVSSPAPAPMVSSPPPADADPAADPFSPSPAAGDPFNSSAGDPFSPAVSDRLTDTSQSVPSEAGSAAVDSSVSSGDAGPASPATNVTGGDSAPVAPAAPADAPSAGGVAD